MSSVTGCYISPQTPPSSDLLLWGEVLLFWNSFLSRGVSSFCRVFLGAFVLSLSDHSCRLSRLVVICRDSTLIRMFHSRWIFHSLLPPPPVSPSVPCPRPRPLPLLFDINIMSARPDGGRVSVRGCGHFCSLAINRWALGHMLIEQIRRSWFENMDASWNSKHAVVSGIGPVIVSTLFKCSALTDGVLSWSTFPVLRLSEGMFCSLRF